MTEVREIKSNCLALVGLSLQISYYKLLPVFFMYLSLLNSIIKCYTTRLVTMFIVNITKWDQGLCAPSVTGSASRKLLHILKVSCVSVFLGKGPECPRKETDRETKSFKANVSRKDVMEDKRSSLLV